MTDAPDRVWVTGLDDQVGPREAYTHMGSWPGSRTEYIRLDLHEAAVAAARAEGMREGFLKSLAHVVAAGSKPNRWVNRAELIDRIRAAAEAPQ